MSRSFVRGIRGDTSNTTLTSQATHPENPSKETKVPLLYITTKVVPPSICYVPRDTHRLDKILGPVPLQSKMGSWYKDWFVFTSEERLVYLKSR